VIVRAVAAVVSGGGGGVDIRDDALLERFGDPSRGAKSGGSDDGIWMCEGVGEREMSEPEEKLCSSTDRFSKRSFVRSNSRPCSD
jgi:hypothetical protein